MRDSEPKAIYLKDYQVPEFLIDKTFLHVALNPTKTRVSSDLHIRRNPESNNNQAALALHGQAIDLVSVSIDGRQLDPTEYVVDSETLTIPHVPESLTLSIVGLVSPETNTSLEGLYKSRKMYCTQCEAEGFRKITYFLDRPDVLSEFTTTVVADKTEFPVLLSNGNPINAGELDDNTHFVTWHDPFPKPAYLFALVGGDLEVIEDSFKTCSGKEVLLRIFVEEKDLDKCDHAMNSLKSAMRWDEEVYGREYDLDIFMIVAVDDFNMGAMENKGLNIFNTSCVLAHPKTTTDLGFQRVEAVVAHEYFHNWSGNRVTCRDWFQLSLKEGFTVFRDAEFSSDMGSRSVKRIDDAKVMRTLQYAEDSGPMAHPVQPASFIEISNFYTLTVYEKGAEVVRMIHTLLGPDVFRKGSDLYFHANDGKAATIDDFVSAMESASGRDLNKFLSWYHQAGTPAITVQDQYNPDQQQYSLTFIQSCPSTPEAKQIDKKPYLIPIATGLIGAKGPIEISTISGASNVLRQTDTSIVLEITETEQTVVFDNIKEHPVPSLLRGYSAPVRLNLNYTREQLLALMTRDEDGFNRWDACQQLSVSIIKEVEAMIVSGREAVVDARLAESFRSLVLDQNLDPAMVALMLTLPSENYLAEIADQVNIETIHIARNTVKRDLAEQLKDNFAARLGSLPSYSEYQPNAVQIAVRALKNVCLDYLVETEELTWIELAYQQFKTADNMTDQIAALVCLVQSDSSSAVQYSSQALEEFYNQWQHEALVVNQWLSVQATKQTTNAIDSVLTLMEHPGFTLENPNKVRSLIGAFANNNPIGFHRADGKGYQLLSSVIEKLNNANPQIASRLLSPLTKWRKYDSSTQELIKAELLRLQNLPELSKDVYEVIIKSLAN